MSLSPKGHKRNAIAHTHTKSDRKGIGNSRETKENNGPSEEDQDALHQSGVPMITVGPDVTTQSFRIDGQDYVEVIEGDVSDVPDLSDQDVKVCGRDAKC
jgi:hypothetical protein